MAKDKFSWMGMNFFPYFFSTEEKSPLLLLKESLSGAIYLGYYENGNFYDQKGALLEFVDLFFSLGGLIE